MAVRVEAGVAIIGNGETITDAVLIMRDKKITFIGKQDEAPSIARDEEPISVPVIMPGMWDSHCHLLGVPTAAIANDMPRIPVAVASARCTSDLRQAVNAGFTSVRELGGYGVELAVVVKEGIILGPKIYAAGALLSPTGGHADVHSLSTDCVHDLIGDGGCDGRWLGLTCDGVAECLKAVRLQIRRNAQVIKICASGGVLTEVDDPHDQQFSDEELRAIVEEATRNRRAVAAHCHGKVGIIAALRAGCLTIEHGSYMDMEAAKLMKEKGAMLVPTRFVISTLLPDLYAGRLPKYIADKGIATAGCNAAAAKMAYELGVPIAVGTDILTSGLGSKLAWGMHGKELQLLMEATGMTAIEAITCATSNGPKTLGPRAPLSGLLRVGYDADVIAVSGNPVQDIALLGDAGNITHVWMDGICVKRNGALLR